MHALLIYIKHLNLQLKLLENVSISYSTGNNNAKKNYWVSTYTQVNKMAKKSPLKELRAQFHTEVLTAKARQLPACHSLSLSYPLYTSLSNEGPKC